MTDAEKLDKLLEFAAREEDRYYEYASNAMNENNMVGNMVNQAQASAYQRVRYAIEDLKEMK